MLWKKIYNNIRECGSLVCGNHTQHVLHHDIPSCFCPFCAIPTLLLFFEKIIILFWYIYNVDITVTSTGKVLHSVSFILVAIILRLMREIATRPQKVSQVAVCRCSEYHAVFIVCQHQRCPYYCLGQWTGATLTLGNAPYRLQQVQFVASFQSSQHC